jgi:hypothetical protein
MKELGSFGGREGQAEGGRMTWHGDKRWVWLKCITFMKISEWNPLFCTINIC